MNNSGVTITETLLSIVIISIVLTLLFTLLINVSEEDTENNIQTEFLINQSTFIKSIEEDIISYGVKSISSCNLSDANISSSVVNPTYSSLTKCIKIEYNSDYIKDKIAFLLIYNYFTKYEVVDNKYQGINDKSLWMIQYMRGNYTEYIDVTNTVPKLSSWKSKTTIMKELPNEVDMSDTSEISYTASSGNTINAASLIIPIKNGSGVHYDINLSFIYKGNNNFKCHNGTNFKCNCLSNESLCNETYN